jgi:hypothetical protein
MFDVSEQRGGLEPSGTNRPLIQRHLPEERETFRVVPDGDIYVGFGANTVPVSDTFAG